jgi:hypothetical protein
MASEKNGSLAKSRVSDAFCKATSIIINQPAPELSKRRQTKLFFRTGASPLMHKRRTNRINDASFIGLVQIGFGENYFFSGCATKMTVGNSNRKR